MTRTALLLTILVLSPTAAQPERLARTYAGAIRRINESHARKPGGAREEDLAKRLPARARQAFRRLLRHGEGPALADALLAAGEAALELDLMKDLAEVRKRLLRISPAHARRLGCALSHRRFLLRGLGGLEPAYLERFAEVMEAVLEGYDEVFGFSEWSKVPGKKLRVRLRLVERITRPPHFAPQFPFHSEIDFPVVDPGALRSPTRDGKFLFYGLCHELGHVIAMWGDRGHEEDHHAWATYTGLVLVEHLSSKKLPFLRGLRDVRWRSPRIERARLRNAGVQPSLDDRDGVLALLFALHDAVGPRSLGKALNLMDRKGRCLRIHRVRYFSFRNLRKALLEVVKDRKGRKAIARLL